MEEGKDEYDLSNQQPEVPRRRKYDEEEENSREYKRKIRIILVGKTGNGKSAVGNSIIGYTGFKSVLSPSSITQKGGIAQIMWDDTTVIDVVDTPGFFDTDKTVEEVALEIVESFGMIAPGPHVILYILSCSEKYTQIEEQTLSDFHELFTGDALKHVIACFTVKDILVKKTKTPAEFICELPKWMRDFLYQIDNRWFFIDNTLHENENQWIDLLAMVEKLLTKNKTEHYSNEILRDVTEKLKLKCIEADKKLYMGSRKWAMIKRNIAWQGDYKDYLKATFVGGGIGSTVGAIGGFFVGNPVIGAIVGGAGSGVMSNVSKAVVRIKRKNICVIS